eukprot:364100-Chlamydomonas_euryale.AAC.65
MVLAKADPRIVSLYEKMLAPPALWPIGEELRARLTKVKSNILRVIHKQKLLEEVKPGGECGARAVSVRARRSMVGVACALCTVRQRPAVGLRGAAESLEGAHMAAVLRMDRQGGRHKGEREAQRIPDMRMTNVWGAVATTPAPAPCRLLRAPDPTRLLLDSSCHEHPTSCAKARAPGRCAQPACAQTPCARPHAPKPMRLADVPRPHAPRPRAPDLMRQSPCAWPMCPDRMRPTSCAKAHAPNRLTPCALLTTGGCTDSRGGSGGHLDVKLSLRAPYVAPLNVLQCLCLTVGAAGEKGGVQAGPELGLSCSATASQQVWPEGGGEGRHDPKSCSCC